MVRLLIVHGEYTNRGGYSGQHHDIEHAHARLLYAVQPVR